MWVQSYVLWLGRTFSLVCLPPMLSWMWVQKIKCLENFPEVGGQPSYRFLHHSGCDNSRLDVLFHYFTSGRFTRVPQVFTDHISQHLTSHKGCSMFFVAWCIIIGTNRWRIGKSLWIWLSTMVIIFTNFSCPHLSRKNINIFKANVLFARLKLWNVLQKNKFFFRSFSRMFTNDLMMCHFVELSFGGYLKTVGGR